MEKKTPLLDEIGRKHGMKVPGNYFADFTVCRKGNFPNSCNLRYGFG